MRLPASMRRKTTRTGTLRSHLSRLCRFAAVGVVGFVTDVATLYLSFLAGFGLLSGRVVSFLAAATVTWFLNRTFTFRPAERPRFREWLGYLSANSIGGAINYGLYALLVTGFELFSSLPVLAVAIGSVAGLLINYALSHTLVFRSSPKP